MIPVSTVGSVIDSSFNPRYIPNLQLWFDAADASTLFNSSTGSTLASPNGSVGRWEDKSFNGWHATQSTSTSQPTRITNSFNTGLNTLRFDGSNDELSVPSAVGIMRLKTEAMFFIVTSSEVKGTTGDPLNIASNTSGLLRMALRTATDGLVRTLYRRLDADAAYVAPFFSAASSSSLACYTAGVKYNAAFASYYINGAQQLPSTTFNSAWTGSTSDTNSFRVTIGSSGVGSYLQGNIAEIIFYDRHLSDTERRALERYLLRKWNIRSYDQKRSNSTDIFSNVDVFLDANNSSSNLGSGNTWTDLSGNGRNGSLINGAVFTTADGISYVNCDGSNDFVNLGNILNYTTQNFTISGWYRFNAFATDNIPFFKGQYQANGFYLTIQSGGNLVFFTNQSGATQISNTSTNAFYTNNWMFISCVRTGSTVRTYVNGTLSTTAYGTHINPASSSDNLLLGAYATFIYSSVRIGLFIAHAKALSDQEVVELYHFTKSKYNKVD